MNSTILTTPMIAAPPNTTPAVAGRSWTRGTDAVGASSWLIGVDVQVGVVVIPDCAPCGVELPEVVEVVPQGVDDDGVEGDGEFEAASERLYSEAAWRVGAV